MVLGGGWDSSHSTQHTSLLALEGSHLSSLNSSSIIQKSKFQISSETQDNPHIAVQNSKGKLETLSTPWLRMNISVLKRTTEVLIRRLGSKPNRANVISCASISSDWGCGNTLWTSQGLGSPSFLSRLDVFHLASFLGWLCLLAVVLLLLLFLTHVPCSRYH